MKEEYDFFQSIKNPYAKKLKKQITIRIEAETIAYFKRLTGEMNIPKIRENPYLPCHRETCS